MVPKLFEYLRNKLGEEVELLHDVHERVTPYQAVHLCKELERYRLFFLEDPLPPEENDHFRLLRQQSSIPLAMGELFNTQHEYVPLITNRPTLHPYSHLTTRSCMARARKPWRSRSSDAWYCPEIAPVGHAAGLALELASYNFNP
jgi:mannonate dehydratase